MRCLWEAGEVREGQGCLLEIQMEDVCHLHSHQLQPLLNVLCVAFKANMYLETCFGSRKVHFLLMVLREMHTCLCSSCVIHLVNAT